MKKVVIGEELDKIIKKSLDILCDTVGSTLGPKGNNSIISSSSLPAFVTDDGVTLARNIESDDVCVNSVLEILKEASIRTDEIVGDGTTTALVLLKDFWMPEFISKRLSQAFLQFGRMSHGFLTNEAVMIGVETRTSSPVRIVRDKETLQHITIRGLFPCGEGAGYAGGIVSAGVDGERCAEAVANYLNR